MGFYEKYKAVFDEVKTVLSDVEAIKQTVLGERFKLHNLPLAVINPAETPVSPSQIGGKFQYQIGFDVILVVRSTEPTDWFSQIISVMGDALDAILADRSLKGTVKDVIPTFFVPGEIRFPATQKMYYGGLISFQALLFYP